MIILSLKKFRSSDATETFRVKNSDNVLTKSRKLETKSSWIIRFRSLCLATTTCIQSCQSYETHGRSGAPNGRGPRFLEPAEPAIATPLYTSLVRNLGIIFNIKNLTFAYPITSPSYLKSASCTFMNHDLRRLRLTVTRPILDYKTACTIASSIVHSKRDYCNSLFYSINSSQIKCLQTFQNALCPRSHENSQHHHITPILKSLHWLKVLQRIHYKIVSLIYNTLQTSQVSTLLNPPTSRHPPTRVYSLIIISFLVWLLLTGIGTAPVNRPKLVFLMWRLWVLISFRRFTLHYIRKPRFYDTVSAGSSLSFV